MNRDQLIKHWDLIEEFKNGAIIEYKTFADIWVQEDSPGFFSHQKYRVKPKLLELWLNEYDAGYSFHDSKKKALEKSANSNVIRTGVHIREVE